MNQFFAVLNAHSSLITAVATTVLAVLTGILWFENRSLRKAGSSPEVVAYLLPHPDGNGGIQFVLANVGRGPAFKVGFTLEYDEEDFVTHKALLTNDITRQPISVLPQDEAVRALIGISFELAGNVGDVKIDPLKPFKVLLTYFNVSGKIMKREVMLDINQFAGLPGILAKSNERKISESLEKIEKQMSAIARYSSYLPALVDITKVGDRDVQKKQGER